MVINQGLNTGILPDKLKLRKYLQFFKRVIPHYLKTTD